MNDRPANPTIAELRTITQPASVGIRAGAGHSVASAYLGDVSLYRTRIMVKAGFSANCLSWLMILSAALAALATAWSTLVGVLLVAVLTQLQMLLDWCDGGVARWRETTSPRRVYLDRIGPDTAGMPQVRNREDGRAASCGHLRATRRLLIGLVVAAATTVVGHLGAALTSSRLR